MTYAVKKQMVKMALMAGEYLIIECAVPAIENNFQKTSSLNLARSLLIGLIIVTRVKK